MTKLQKKNCFNIILKLIKSMLKWRKFCILNFCNMLPFKLNMLKNVTKTEIALDSHSQPIHFNVNFYMILGNMFLKLVRLILKHDWSILICPIQVPILAEIARGAQSWKWQWLKVKLWTNSQASLWKTARRRVIIKWAVHISTFTSG